MMRKFKLVLPCVFLLAAAGNAHAVGEMVLGDSLGVGVKLASGHPGLARLSQFIRNDQLLAQINQVPVGATAIMVAGTNDSAGSVKGLDKYIDNIVRAVDARKIKLIWVGPPCVRKSWDRNASELDAMLAARFARTSIKYVSLRNDQALCSGQYTGGDGVHLNFAGYTQIWNKARVVAGLPDSEGKAVAVAAVKPSAARSDTPTRRADRSGERASMPGSNRYADRIEPRTPRQREIARAEPAPSNPIEGLFFWLRRN